MISEDYNKRMSGYYTQELSLCLQTILLLFELQSKTDSDSKCNFPFPYLTTC